MQFARMQIYIFIQDNNTDQVNLFWLEYVYKKEQSITKANEITVLPLSGYVVSRDLFQFPITLACYASHAH